MSKSSSFSGYLLRGIIILAAPAVTLWAVQYTANFADAIAPIGQSVRLFSRIFLPEAWSGSPAVQWFFPYVSLAVLAGVAALFGFVASFRIGSQGLRLIDYFFFAIPGVRFIFTNVKKVLEIFKGDDTKPRFSRSVAFRYAGQTAFGFASSTTTDAKTGKKFIIVFVPFQFVPPSGFLLPVPEEDVWDTGLTAEETIRAVVTMGGITPDSMNLTKPQ